MRYSALAAAILIAVFATNACAIGFKIIVVKPSREGSEFDGGLSPYKKQLMELGYKSAKIVSTERINPGLNETAKLNIATKTKVELTPTGEDDSFVKYDLKITHVDKEPVKFSYRLPKGKHTFVVGSSPKHKYLIIIKSTD